MTNKNIRRIIIAENGLITFFSLIFSLISGTGFSIIFLKVILKIIDISGVNYKISIKSYIITAIFFVILYFVVIAIGLISSYKYKIANLLKENKREEANLISNPFWGIVGIIFIIVSFIDMTINFKTGTSYVLLRSFLLCFTGVFLLISNLAWVINLLYMISKKIYYSKLLSITNIKYSFVQSKKILFVTTLIVSITVFFITIGVSQIYESRKIAVESNPFKVNESIH